MPDDNIHRDDWRPSDAEWDDEVEEADWPDDADDPAGLIACPKCGCDIYEESEQCPLCGEYILDERPPLEGKPAWFLLLGLLGIIAVVIALSGLGPVLF